MKDLLQIRQVNLNMTAFKVWTVISGSGTIHSAHCNCMAGLGEAYSHIAATLFAVASIFLRRIQDNPTCTSMPCQWKDPSLQTLQTVEYGRGCDIAFTEAKRKKRAEKQKNNIPVLSTPAVNNRALSEAQKNEP